jgi:hypothetical protein
MYIVKTELLTDTARIIISHFRSRAPAELQPCPLMKLPAELRNRVMDMLFRTNTNTVYIRQRGIHFGFGENTDGPGESMNQLNTFPNSCTWGSNTTN